MSLDPEPILLEFSKLYGEDVYFITNFAFVELNSTHHPRLKFFQPRACERCVMPAFGNTNAIPVVIKRLSNVFSFRVAVVSTSSKK